MGRSNNNSLISGESGGGGGSGPVTSTSPSVYLPNFPPTHHLPHQYSHHHHQLPPSPPIHPQQYINMGHLASAAVFYDATNNSCSVNPNVTPPARVYSPLSHGSSNGSSISYASSPGGAGGGGGGGGGVSNGTLTIMEAVQAVTNVGGSGPSVKFEYEDFPQEPDGGPVKTATWKDHVAVFNMDQVKRKHNDSHCPKNDLCV